MPFKLIIMLMLFSNISACSSSTASSKTSTDTRTCSALSYGNKNIDIQSMDGIYAKCMDDKNKIRNQQKKDDKNIAILEFFVELFFQAKKEG